MTRFSPFDVTGRYLEHADASNEGRDPTHDGHGRHSRAHTGTGTAVLHNGEGALKAHGFVLDLHFAASSAAATSDPIALRIATNRDGVFRGSDVLSGKHKLH